MLNEFLQDIRIGFRALRRSPGFFVVAVVTLALGIGANTAIFSVVNGVLLRDLPFEDPSRLIVIWNDAGEEGQSYPATSPGDYEDYKERSQTFEAFAATGGGSVILTGDGEPERVDARSASANLFPMLGVKPLLGRNFTEEEATPGGPFAGILTHGLWERRYGKDPNILDNPIQLNGNAIPVVGVLAPDFKIPLPKEVFGSDNPALFFPARFNPQNFVRNFTIVNALGRLKPGVTLAQAQEEMDNIAAQLRAEHAIHESSGMTIRLVPLHDDVVKDVRGMLLMLFGAVALVLLIACANVANLLLARAAGRRKEIAIRVAVGAGRARIVRQILAESLLLSVPGAALALLVADVSLDWMLLIQPGNLPRVENIEISGVVLFFTALAGISTTFLFGLAPALYASRSDLQMDLKEGGKTSAVGQQSRVRNLLVTGEVALSLVLLVGAGLLLKSFWALQQVEPGFRPKNVLSFRVSPSGPQFRGAAARAQFFRELKDRLVQIPGVESAAVASQLPLTGAINPHPYAYDEESERNWESLTAEKIIISPGFFKVMGTRILSGRDFHLLDNAESEPVAIIDTLLANRAWPGEDPIGKRLLFSYFFPDRSPPDNLGRQRVKIVGLVEHVRDKTLNADVREHVYVPSEQQRGGSNVVVKTSGADIAGLPNLIRDEVREMNSQLPVTHMQPLDFYVTNSLSGDRFGMILIGIFAGLAVGLASIGLYGVIAYLVSQRLHEFGIRVAMGASNGDIFRLVLTQGLKLAVIGVGSGLLASMAFSRVLRSFLFEVSAVDPVTYLVVSVLLVGVTLAACCVPAFRATRVDPMVALRYE